MGHRPPGRRGTVPGTLDGDTLCRTRRYRRHLSGGSRLGGYGLPGGSLRGSHRSRDGLGLTRRGRGRPGGFHRLGGGPP
ncbi:hypothetical protein ACPF8X_41065, partial [Streptomyces sp. G35A]